MSGYYSALSCVKLQQISFGGRIYTAESSCYIVITGHYVVTQLVEGRQEGRKAGRKEGRRKEGRKEGRKGGK